MKIGDHVGTIYGNGTVISGKRVQIHGKKDCIKVIEKGVVKGVLRTKEQVEEDSIKQHKKEMRLAKAPKK